MLWTVATLPFATQPASRKAFRPSRRRRAALLDGPRLPKVGVGQRRGHQAVLGVRPDQFKDGLGVGPVGA